MRFKSMNVSHNPQKNRASFRNLNARLKAFLVLLKAHFKTKAKEDLEHAEQCYAKRLPPGSLGE